MFCDFEVCVDCSLIADRINLIECPDGEHRCNRCLLLSCVDCGLAGAMDEMEYVTDRNEYRCTECTRGYFNRLPMRLLGTWHLLCDGIAARVFAQER